MAGVAVDDQTALVGVEVADDRIDRLRLIGRSSSGSQLIQAQGLSTLSQGIDHGLLQIEYPRGRQLTRLNAGLVVGIGRYR